MSYMENQLAFAPVKGIQELSFDEIDTVDGAKLSAGETVAYTIIGVAAIATGAGPAIFAGTFLLAMTGYLA